MERSILYNILDSPEVLTKSLGLLVVEFGGLSVRYPTYGKVSKVQLKSRTITIREAKFYN